MLRPGVPGVVEVLPQVVLLRLCCRYKRSAPAANSAAIAERSQGCPIPSGVAPLNLRRYDVGVVA